MRRLIIVAAEEGEPVTVEYEPEDAWDLTEARMYLREAVELVSEQIEEES